MFATLEFMDLPWSWLQASRQAARSRHIPPAKRYLATILLLANLHSLRNMQYVGQVALCWIEGVHHVFSPTYMLSRSLGRSLTTDFFIEGI